MKAEGRGRKSRESRGAGGVGGRGEGGRFLRVMCAGRGKVAFVEGRCKGVWTFLREFSAAAALLEVRGGSARVLQPSKGGQMKKVVWGRSATAIPRHAEAERAVEEARRVFARTLACWASDVLHLRREGLLRPRWGRADAAGRLWSKAA